MKYWQCAFLTAVGLAAGFQRFARVALEQFVDVVASASPLGWISDCFAKPV